jgi:putative flippase GtrA
MVHVAVCLVHLGFTALLVEAGGVAPAWAALISAATLTAPVFLLLDRLVFTAAR